MRSIFSPLFSEGPGLGLQIIICISVSISTKSREDFSFINQVMFVLNPVMCWLLSVIQQVFCSAIFCRDELKRHYTLGEYWIEVEMEDLASFDEDLSDCLYKLPTENLSLVSTAWIHTLLQQLQAEYHSNLLPINWVMFGWENVH